MYALFACTLKKLSISFIVNTDFHQPTVSTELLHALFKMLYIKKKYPDI